MLDKVLNPGEVELTLDGEPIILKPTMEAAIVVNVSIDAKGGEIGVESKIARGP